jgi:hypothetical protein
MPEKLSFIFFISAIVVGGLVTYPEEFLLFEENFEDSSHVQRLDAVVTMGTFFCFFLVTIFKI